MGVNIKGGNNSVGLANVTSTYDLNVVTPDTTDAAGFAHMSAQNDDGTVTGSVLTIPSEISDDYRLRVGQDGTIFNTAFEGTVVNTSQFFQVISTATVTQANGFMTVNGNSQTGSGLGNYIRTYRHFPTYGTYPTYLDMWIKETGETASNAVSEWGFLYLTTITTPIPLDGLYFRRLSTGPLRAVVNYGGTETEYTINTANIPSRDGVGTYSATEVNHYLIAYHNDVVRFWINDVLVASVDCPGSQQALTSSSNTPVGFRVINTGAVTPTARQIQVGFINVSYGDQNTTKLWGHTLSGSGQGSYQSQMGSAVAQTSLWANSAAPATVSAPSNTAVGGANQGYTTLGGMFILSAVAGAETDYLLFGYQNPVGTANLAGKTLYVTGIRIGETFVTGAAVATTATILQFAVGVNSTAASLATTDSTTSVKPRIVPLGGQSFAISAAIGTSSPGFQVDFSHAPLAVAAGNFLDIVVRQPVGTATASSLYRGSVTIIGYFE